MTVENSEVEFICQKSDMYKKEITALLVFVRLKPVKRNRHFQCMIQFYLKYMCKIDQMSCSLKC